MMKNKVRAVCTPLTEQLSVHQPRHPFITQLQPLKEGQIQFAGVLKMNFYFNQLNLSNMKWIEAFPHT